MLKCAALFSVSVCCFAASGAAGAAEPAPTLPAYVSLAGKAVAGGNAADKKGLIHTIAEPVLHLVRAEGGKAKGTVLLFPGGGYVKLAMVHEGTQTARFLNAQGFDVAMLEYHVSAGPETRELALADALAAFRLLKVRHAELGVAGGRFGIMGYSAGGHLAARTVQRLAADEQPDDLILIYPAYLQEKVAGADTPAVQPPAAPKPRLFALIAVDDHAEWVRGIQAYAKTWQASQGRAEFHLLPNGRHGFGMRAGRTGAAKSWPDRLATFLDGKRM